MPVRFGREIVGDLRVAETREWLVTNRLGSYASGSVAGSITRGYHGLLVAALRPPIDRRVMLVKLDETVTYRGTVYELATNRWAGGSVAPEGYKNIESFAFDGSIPCWRYACGDALIEKRIWMEDGAHTTYVAWTLLAAAAPVHLSARAIVDNRVFHNTGQMAWPVTLDGIAGGMRVTSGGGDARPLVLRMAGAQVDHGGDVYRGFLLPQEAARGLRDSDDHVHAATFSAAIEPGGTLLFLGSAEDAPALDDGALERRRTRDRTLISAWQRTRPPGAPDAPSWIEQLVLAADQFVVDRPSPEQPDGKSVIAGYHWFEDWGRDTMISLPGLSLSTGRPEIAAPILRTFARFVSQGMLPNRFPDAAEQPEYNTIDATLWYLQAIRAYVTATDDDALLRDLFGHLEDIIDWHIKGTRYGIQADPDDGLLHGGADGVQLTWMDAKVGDHVITPRIGKPIEVNALWYNALRAMEAFAGRIGKPAQSYRARADAALAGFERFWNAEKSYCYDVLDGPHGNEDALRPNQIFAVSLPECPLSPQRQRAVLDACSGALLTSHGLRSLAPGDHDYVGFYGGDQWHRDGAYHEGTVWGWLIGPFIAAHLRVHNDPATALRLLEPFADHLYAAGLGSISEIFDGDAPFEPRGCIAQAWSVGEALRSFALIEQTR